MAIQMIAGFLFWPLTAIVACFHLGKRKDLSAMARLGWLLLMLVIPGFGVVFYLWKGNGRLWE